MDDWPRNYTYYVDENISDCVYIKEITNEEEALNWLQEYELKTGTSWTVVRTYPTTGTKILFRKEWKCQFNVRQYPHPPTKNDSTKVRSSKHLACPAKINLTVSRIIKKRPRSAKAHLHSELPCQLIIHGEHNHPKDSAVILRHNKIREDTKEKLFQLFMTGHSATSAREALKLELYIHYPEDYYKLAADNGNVPSIHAVQGLLKKTFRNKHISRKGEVMDKHLQILLTKYCEETGGSVKMDRVGSHKFVAICSPLMKRAHSLPQSAELMFVDASRNLNKKNHRVFMFNTPTPAGGIPLGCIVTDVEKKEVFSAALKSLKECFPENSFFRTKSPVVIMTDYSLKDMTPLEEEWSDATFLLCQFKLLKTFWNWLLQTDHKIKNCDRQEMYFAFKRLIHAENEEMFSILYENITKKYEFSYPNFVKYIQHLRKYDKTWATFYRRNLSICDNDISNYTGIVFRILKDVILEKVKAFNLTQLVDFILVRYESYMERHLLDFAYGRYSTDLIRKYLPASNGIDGHEIFKSDKENDIYFVPSESQLGSLHVVDIQHGLCTCIRGEFRVVCSHLSAVMKLACVDEELFKESNSTQATIFEIATGIKPPEGCLLSFYNLPGVFENFTDTDPSAMQISDENFVEAPVLCIQSEIEHQMKGQKQDPATYRNHEEAESSNIESLTSEEHKELASVFERISKSVENNPKVFVPAVRKLLQNIKDFVKTDSSLQSALYNFGQCTGQSSVNTVSINSRFHTKTHSNSFKRRKSFLGSNWYLQNGSYISKKLKTLKDHEYCKH